MYVLLIVIAGVVGLGLIFQGARKRSAGRSAAGVLVLAATALLFALMSFWAEMLWFRYVGYSGRFWTALVAATVTSLIAAALAGISVFLLTPFHPRETRSVRRWAWVAGVALGGLWGLLSWEIVLQHLHRVDTGVTEPVLGRDVGFYLFTLPFLQRAHWLLVGVVGLALAATAAAATMLPGASSWADLSLRRRRPRPADFEPAAPLEASSLMAPLPAIEPAEPVTPVPPETGDGLEGEAPPAPGSTVGLAALTRPLLFSLGFLAITLALGRWLGIYELLYSRFGVVYGPGWTDVHIRLPAYHVVAAALAFAGIALLGAAVSGRVAARVSQAEGGLTRALLVPASAVASIWVVGLLVLPLLVQWLYVSPNEITVERPYLARNIELTRQGFDLHDVEEQAFAPTRELTPAVLEANEHLLSEVRLWDPQALQSVLEQFQEFRLYYEMAEIDIDRYALGGRYRQVMVTAREMEQDNLPRESQTFVNRYFKYTHGYGLAMASAHDFTPDGLPNLLVKNIPPLSQHPELRVDRPEIYYGQHTRDFAVANTREPEFDYPAGEANVYSKYSGTGGVELSSFWRRLVYGWTHGGTRLVFSSYPTPESRILYRRQVGERVSALAPFLDFDLDAYIVVAGGRLKWIVDGYTSSRHYPYSDPYFEQGAVEPMADGQVRQVAKAGVADYLLGKNYVRNAVKAVVDAYDGTVTFYVFEPEDPILQVWSRIYPGMFRAEAEMPAELRAHVRYPEGFLLAQGLVFAKYHMTDPEVFYNQEDLWIRSTERYYDEVRPVDPYYVMWKPPQAREAEFSLIQPFTPKNRQVLIGWIAGLSDGESYGRLIAYRFPKDEWILGTQQVDTKIDQDGFLSAQLSLWDQHGSRVIRGNVLVIPIGGTLLYVEPIYLQAASAAYPELRLVVLMHGDQMSYASTFRDALRGLVDGRPPERQAGALGVLTGDTTAARRANDALGSYLRLQGERRFEEAAAELRKLEATLKELDATPSAPGMPPGER